MNTDKELDEIYEVLFEMRTTHEVEHNDNVWRTEFVYSLDEAKQHLEALIHRHQNQLLDKLLEEVIGEDETYEGVTMNWAIEHQNILRATQREAINKLRSSK